MDVKDVIQEDGVDEKEPRRYATLEDFCQPPPIEERRLRNGAWIKYRPWIPADRMAEIQLICRGTRRGQKWDTSKFFQYVLQEVLIDPKVRTDKDRKVVMKGDSAVILGIINETVGSETFAELQEELGE